MFEGYKYALVYLMKYAPNVDDPYCYICLLFLADIKGLEEGCWISEDTYLATENGICLKESYKYLYNELLFRNIGRMYAQAELHLSDKKQEILQTIIKEYAADSLESLREHTRTSTWRHWSLKNRPIPFPAIVQDLDILPERKESLEIDYHNWTLLKTVFDRPVIDL